MRRPNVTVRSNVYIRSPEPLEKDHAFRAQIRGRGAIHILLQRLAPFEDLRMASRRLLTPRQMAEVAWQVPCVCGSYPEGPVLRNGTIDIRFRCPRGTCTSSSFRTRICLLDAELIAAGTRMFGLTVPELVEKALTETSRVATDSTTSQMRRRFAIRLTLFQDNMLTDEQVESALRSLVKGDRS